jgi:flagellar biosynthesis anti-sigma factor FlgM
MGALFGAALPMTILGPPMPISPLNEQDPLRAARAVAAMRRTSPSAMPSTAVRQSDSIELSDAARALAVAHNAVADAADIRADRVAEIKAAIASGTYSVDSRQLARAMVRDGVV